MERGTGGNRVQYSLLNLESLSETLWSRASVKAARTLGGSKCDCGQLEWEHLAHCMSLKHNKLTAKIYKLVIENIMADYLAKLDLFAL